METSFGQLVLTLPGGGVREFTLSKASISLGRSGANDIVVPDTVASRNHARLDCNDNEIVLFDLGSANGTFVNGRKVQQATLVPGDLIAIGEASFRFRAASPELDVNLTGVMAEDELLETIAPLPLEMELSETSGPRLAIHTRAKTWEIPFIADSILIGRHSQNDIVLDSPKVSRRHTRIERVRDDFVVSDLDSNNGTWVAGRRITRQPLLDGDTIRVGDARIVFKAGFRSQDLTVTDVATTGGAKRRPVVVVPGFAGTNLYHGSEQIWPNPRRMVQQPEMLHMDVPLEPRGVLREVVVLPGLIKLDQYSLLVDYLYESLGYETGKDLLEFGYDFRQDIRDTARKLAEAIDTWNPGRPITIIAHSMGCLVSRYYTELLGGKAKIERLILLGGPHQGTPYSFASLLKGPDLLPFGMRNDRLRDVLGSFPAWYQILPTYGFAFDGKNALDLITDPTWLTEDRRDMLQYYTSFRSELGTRSSVPTVCIFGYGLKTITSATLERDPGALCRKINLGITPSGDGTIPERSSVMDGAEIHPVRQHHGTLYVDSDVRMRLKLELTRR